MYLRLSEYANQYFYLSSENNCPPTKIQTEYYCQTENLILENTTVETTSNALIKKYTLTDFDNREFYLSYPSCVNGGTTTKKKFFSYCKDDIQHK